MKQSGNKLVIGLACLALAAGLASWLYRYGATHLATQFWGREAALLIARPSEVELLQLELAGTAEDSEGVTLDLGRPYLATPVREIAKERGMVHFRHALMTDGNYVWDAPLEASEIDWRWGLRFYDGEIEATLLLAADLATIGLVNRDSSPQVQAISCQPMAKTLEGYFRSVDLFRDGDSGREGAASTPK